MAYRHDQELNKLKVVGLSATTFYSGTTNLSDIFVTQASLNPTYVQNGINTFTGGTAQNPTINITSATLANLSTSGTNTANSFFATTLSGGTIYSGNTNLYDIFLTTNDGNDITRVQNGTNTFTGGTANAPSVNITSATLANLSTSGTNVANSFSATTLSGGTIYSGTTNLYSIFQTVGTNSSPFSGNPINGAIMPVSGSNVASGSWSFVAGGKENLASGTYSHAEGFQTSATSNASHSEGGSTLSSGFFSHSEGFQTTAVGITSHSEGLSTTALGASSHSEGQGTLAFGSRSSAGGYFSTSSGDTSFIHSNRSTVGSDNASILGGLSNRLNSTATGSTILGGSYITGNTRDTVYVPNLTATTNIYAAGIFSGTTNLYDIFLTSGSINPTYVQNGINTFTGGTAQNPTVNITSATLANLSTSGTNTANSFSATTLSGGTIYSGTTNLQNTFNSFSSEIGLINNQLPTKANLSGATFTGGVYAPTLSGGTIYSGSTNLYDIFLTSDEVINGSGIVNYLPIWTGSTTLASSIISQSNSGITIHGNLTVQGTATTVNSVNLAVSDNTITINSGETGGGVTAGVAGLIVDRGTQPAVQFLWVESGQTWSVSNPIGTGSTLNPILTTDSIDNGPISSPNNSINIEVGTGLNQDIVYLSANFDNSTIGLNGSGQLKVLGVTGITNGTNTTANNIGNGVYNVSLNDSPSINNLSFSGTATGGNLIGTSISATTFYSGSTELSNVLMPFNLNTVRVTATTYTVVGNVQVVSINQTGATTVNLLASPSLGRMIVVKDATLNADRILNPITVNGNGTNIDNAANTIFENNYESATFVYDGSIYITI